MYGMSSNKMNVSYHYILAYTIDNVLSYIGIFMEA